MSRRRTNPELFIRYLEWGIRAGAVAPLLGLLVGLLRFDFLVSAREAVAVAVWGVGLLALDWWARWAIGRLAGRSLTTGQRRQLIVATGVTVVSVVAMVVLVGDRNWWLLTGAITVLVWAGCVTLVVRLWQAGVIALMALAGLVGAALSVLGVTELGGMVVGILVVLVPVMIGGWWLSAWHLRVLHELREARDLAAQSAVNDERARISRDLHDVFGQTLAAIAVKSELAAELASRGRAEAAAAEMRDIHQLADRAGARVRAVVRGEGLVDLAGEIDGARALLAAAGISCRVTAVPGTAQADVLVWVLRESVTNILRHSQASAATIDLSEEDGQVKLRVANDGAGSAAPEDPLTGAGGLGGIASRVDLAGGQVRVEHTEGWFVVEAALPTPVVGQTAPTTGPMTTKLGAA